jgi:periplasmic divalent cation tolerance protein
MENSYCMVITTAPDQEKAEKLAEGILGNRLAACVQMADIRSFLIFLQQIANIGSTGDRDEQRR